MKKRANYILLLTLLLGWGCTKNDPVRYSVPAINSVTINTGSELSVPGAINFSANVADAVTPLSTLEVEVKDGANVFLHKSIRTKGNSVSLTNEVLDFPFLPNVKDGKAVDVKFTLINVDGNEVTVTKNITLKRPILPDTLYLKSGGADVKLAKITGTSQYASEEGSYKSIFTAKVATGNDLETASFIWGAGQSANNALITDRFGSDMNISFPTWLVSRIIFDAETFKVSVEGQEVTLVVKNKTFSGNGSYFYSKVSFVKNEEFDITGIDNPELQYNRDFFTYNATTKKFTFTGETGDWDVYYSLKYKYFWVNRMNDVYPKCLWGVGHGFNSSFVWNTGFNSIGWDLDDPAQLAYFRPIGGSKYQAQVYLVNTHDWGDFDLQLYSNRTWSADMAVFDDTSFTGDAEGIKYAGGASADILSTTGFVPGFYRLTVDVSAGLPKTKILFERLVTQ
ncbi:MAG: hypothetical protein PHV20_07035 [Bacteroidales bacterium]|nr:hypothetical protein [Bacteroidales bacterium]